MKRGKGKETKIGNENLERGGCLGCLARVRDYQPEGLSLILFISGVTSCDREQLAGNRDRARLREKVGKRIVDGNATTMRNDTQQH